MTSKRRNTLFLAGFAITTAVGCQAILGIDTTSFEPTGDAGSVDGSGGDGGGNDGSQGGDSSSSVVLTVSPSSGHLVRGSTLDVDITLGSPAPSDAVVTATGLPSGVTASALTIASGSTSGTLRLAAGNSAKLGSAIVTVGSPVSNTAPLDLLVGDAAGVLDVTFDNDGIKLFPSLDGGTGASATAVAAQSDGHIIVASTQDSSGTGWFITRIAEDGVTDSAFAANAAGVLPTGTVSDVAVGPDDKVTIVGNSQGYATVVRLNPDGTPDNGFNFTGVARANDAVRFSSGNSAAGVAIESDGTAIVVGSGNPTGANYGLVLHFLNNGTLDQSFDGAGSEDYANGANNTALTKVVIDPSGRIVAGGSDGSVSPALMYLVRLSADGTPDNTFGASGIVRVATGSGAPESTNGVAAQLDAGYVVAGADFGGVGLQNALAFVSARGDAGTAIVNDNPVGNTERLTSVAPQTDGKFLTVGFGGGSFTDIAYLYRMVSPSSADVAFNDGGIVEFETGGMPGDPPKIFFHDVTTLPDGRIVVVGSEAGGGVIVMRFWQ